MQMMMLNPAANTLAAALEMDPFYKAVTSMPGSDGYERRQKLAQYFNYSLEEAAVLGRTVYLEDPSLGASAWLVPADAQIQDLARLRKRTFLRNCLGEQGLQIYESIVGWMAARSAPLGIGAWYLSIIAVAPHAQGRGFGQMLLSPTLREADALGARCYLETFSLRTIKFYERLGFRTTQTLREPTTGADYALMIRSPFLKR